MIAGALARIIGLQISGWRMRHEIHAEGSLSVRPQATFRTVLKGQDAAIERRQIGDDRKPETRAGFRFIEALPARERGLALISGESRPIVIDRHPEKAALREIAARAPARF